MLITSFKTRISHLKIAENALFVAFWVVLGDDERGHEKGEEED